MNSINKKAYVYKMNLIPANILCIAIFVLMAFITLILKVPFYDKNTDIFLTMIGIILYLMLHEFLHGVGYFIGGVNRKNITYGIELEKGIFYAMAYQELTKKNILVSLLMPFTVIGVITYIIGIVFYIPVLVLLSIINISGAAMDLMMFIYILRLPSDTMYSESGNPDEFVLISKEDLSKKKSIFLKIIETKKYKKSDYIFENKKKINITKLSMIILIIFVIIGIVGMVL